MITPEMARDVVQKDVEQAIGPQLTEGRGFRIDEGFADWEANPLTNIESTQVMVPWTWHGNNAGLLGLDPTDREITQAILFGTRVSCRRSESV